MTIFIITMVAALAAWVFVLTTKRLDSGRKVDE